MLPRSARVEALQIQAAANLPEAGGERRPAAARAALTQLLRLDLANEIPAELSTPALDSLYRQVRETVYAISVIVRRDNPITGIHGTSLLRVRANRPSSFKLTARSKDGIESIPIDSVMSSMDTTLALRVGRNGQLLLRGSEYEFVVTAVDIASRETLVRTYDGTVAIPAIEYLILPPTVDSALLKPERAAPERTPGIITGIVVAGATVLMGKNLRADEPIKSAFAPEGRYMSAAVLIAVGAGVAAWFDRGRVLDRNVQANRRLVLESEAQRRVAIAENAKRAADYRANITLNTEGR
ncbi:MAG TPA: hypothetical protein VF981_03240 [Gemmatimonadaceae bacterium]